MKKNVSKKLKCKRGVSALVVTLIMAVLFSAVTYGVSKNVGNAAKNGGTTTASQITNSISDAATYAGSGDAQE